MSYCTICSIFLKGCLARCNSDLRGAEATAANGQKSGILLCQWERIARWEIKQEFAVPLWISPSAFPSENHHLNVENYDKLNNYCELQIAGSDIPEFLELQMANLTKHYDLLLLQILGERGKVYRNSDNGFQWYQETQTKEKSELTHRSLAMYSVQNNVYCFCCQLFSNKKISSKYWRSVLIAKLLPTSISMLN